MRRNTPRILAMLFAFAVPLGLASPAMSADGTTTATRTVKSKVVHQGGIIDVKYERRVLKVSALPDDSECGSWSHTRHVVTYDSQDCATGTNGARVVVRNDNGSRSRTRLNVVVENNRHVKTPAQQETNRRELVNRDGKHPVRCDFTRSGEVVIGRFIPAGGNISILTKDDDIDYVCYYVDGAHAGYGTIDVRRVNTGAYLYNHPKMEVITLGCNASRNNEVGTCRIDGPNGWSKTITAPAGEKAKKHFEYQGLGKYTAWTLEFDGSWERQDKVVLD